MSHPTLCPPLLPLPPFTLVCSEMNFSSLVLRGISTPYLPCVPSSTRMKWEWLLSRHDRLPWFSSSSMYSAGKPPCKVQEERLWEMSGRAAEEHQMPKATSMWDRNRPACGQSGQTAVPAVLTSALSHAPLTLLHLPSHPQGSSQEKHSTHTRLCRVEGLLSKQPPGTITPGVAGFYQGHQPQARLEAPVPTTVFGRTCPAVQA